MEGFTQYSVVHGFERACGKASLTCEKPHYYSGLAKCAVHMCFFFSNVWNILQLFFCDEITWQ